ncbi:MAG: zinc-binding dehydrogenase, partial [Spirochaetaceae bacterium]|nr:zinc-binding dehydrogenase [Spirochaetaceae bacterium]
VHGCGGVGLSAVMIGSALGANVIGIDISDEKLSLARSLGAVYTVNSRDTDPVAAVRDFTKGGVHLSLDALGHPETCRNSIESLRKRGRHIQVGLLLGDQKAPPIPMDRVIADELEIYGSHGIQAHRYDAVWSLAASGKVDPALLLGRRIGLDDAAGALMAMDDFHSVGMTIIDPEG